MNRREWEKHYCEASTETLRPPDELLTGNRRLLTGGRALDIAMGSGRNALFLVESGYRVIGIDRSESAARLARAASLKRGLDLETAAADMLDVRLGTERFDLIANFYFLERNLIEGIKRSLKAGGLLFFETFTSYGISPDDPRYHKFLLEPNELLSVFTDFFIIFYHERVKDQMAAASLIARKV